jgi:probable rRNA maturation factor
MTADFVASVNAAGFEAIPVGLMENGVRRTVADRRAGPGEISVTLFDDAAIRTMNRDYLDVDRPTDVIAFSLGDEARVLGDIYIGYEQAARQADDLGVELDHELVRLAIHGTLHVLGFDHPEGPNRAVSPMFAVQERLVAEVLAGKGAP